MRRHLRERAASVATEETKPESPEAAAFERAALAMGASPAAWLLWPYRRQLRTTGAVDFVMPDKLAPARVEQHRWFFLAMQHLRRRPLWSVEVGIKDGKRRYRVKWLGGRWRTRPATAPRPKGPAS